MNVYDFDNTIYSGESALDFYVFCARRNAALYRYAFAILAAWARYKLLLLSRERLTELAERYAQKFISAVGDLDALAHEFWDGHEGGIKELYLKNRRDDDVVISASADFLLRDICARIGVKRLICSEVDTKTGRIGRLCFGQNKPELFAEAFPGAKIENFYSDSMNDLPMMRLAENAYLVKGEKIIPVPKEKLVEGKK